MTDTTGADVPMQGDKPERDEYSFLTRKQWKKVCKLLARDLRSPDNGVRFCAPEYPEAGQEAIVYITAQTAGMWWLGDDDPPDRTLSDVIRRCHGSAHDYDELRRMRLSLANTVAVLDAALAERFPDKP
jgi:hypothetical protein